MNKYFTPQIEDFRVGYKCETKQSSGWYNWIVNDIHDVMDLYGRLSTNDVRTKYLDKDDIESLGWKQISAISGENFEVRFLNKIFEMGVLFNSNGNNIRIKIYNPLKTETYSYPNILYSGRCPSINELKYIMKLLNIK